MAPLDLARIDTLILDLGGVLIDVDYDRSAQAFKALGVERFEEQFSKAKQVRLFDEFEIGAITPVKFREAIGDLFGRQFKGRQIDDCWNAMLGSVPAARIELVEALRMRYRVYLLSNTNAIHVPAFLEIIRRDNRIADFRQEFDGVFFSNEIGLRKPDASIFQHVLTATHASSDRTLFIDDSIQHVEGARRAGLNAAHLDLSHEDIIRMVERLGLLV